MEGGWAPRRAGSANTMSNMCPTHPPVANLSAPSWNGWSPDMTKNNRYQTAKAAGGLGPKESGATEALRRHGFSPAAVARLELKWAFGLPWTSSAYGQPTVVDGRVFIGSDSGYLYSLDAATGCVHWSFQAQAGLAQHADDRPSQARREPVGGVLRRHSRQRVRGRRVQRKAPVENTSRCASAGAYHGKRHGA